MLSSGIRTVAVATAVLCAFAGTAFAQGEAGGEAAVAAAPEQRPADLFARDRFEITPIICPFKGAIRYKPGEVSCGRLLVPENREKPDSREIALNFVKIHARKPEKWDAKKNGEWFKREDAIIYLTGGPGAQAAGYVKRFVSHGVRDVRDLYVLEQRGIGWSQDFCPMFSMFDPSRSNTPDFQAYQRAQFAAVEDCFAKAHAAGVDLSGYNTIENARDVEALRRALGFKEWNVWGISYGSILGQAYLRQDPKGIRAAVIDAIVPIDPTFRFQKIGGSYNGALDELVSACEADASCAAAYPDLKGRLTRAIATARENGPVEIKALDSELFPAGKAWFFHDIVGGIPFIQFYEQKNYPTLPMLISGLADRVEKNDWRGMEALTLGGAGGPAGFSVSQGMYNAIACNDNWYSNMREALEEDRREHPDLASLQGDPALIDELGALCPRYGMNPRDAAEYAPLETDIRTLIVEGAMDPITPPPFAKKILPGFSNGTYVEFAYAGHGPSRSVKCAGEFLTKFYDSPDGALDTSCPESMTAPKFSAPAYPTRALLEIAAKAGADPKNAVLPALWFGLPAIILVLGSVIYLLSPVARLINGAAAPAAGGARLIAFLTAAAGAASVLGLAGATAASFQASELIAIVGLLPIARPFVYAGLAAGALGVLLLAMTATAGRKTRQPIGSMIGFVLTAVSGAALAAFYLINGVAVF